jgi:photosystem II stability/assembly factor-like uncharacterized protein
MSPKNPRILYAAMWTAERKPFTMLSGGEESGLYRSADGGETWKELTNGLPQGIMGRIGVTISGANPNRVWALIEAEGDEGGIYRSEDDGQSFRKINGDRNFLQRAWYYTHIVADPVDENTVYVMNAGFYRSIDGGESFGFVSVPHGDNHDLWIHPSNNQIMVESNDGGANVSYNGGASWTPESNQPTAEFYRATVDDQFPYHVYGAQQDNTTVGIASRTLGLGIDETDWYPVGGGESGHIAVDPRDPNIVYAGSYGGLITRYDHRTKTTRNIVGYPELALGQKPADLKYRFQWSAPIRISHHDPRILYHTSNYVHESRDEGQSWRLISLDLTRNDPEHQDFAGGPITRDSTGVEVYGTIFSFEESPLEAGVLWAGSDDGKLHVTRNQGESWEDVTPPGLPELSTINSIDLSRHEPGRAHIAAYRYRYDDFTPYLFQTNDYGKTWKRIADGTHGIPADHFTRVVREDPDRRGLLYAGTEFGMYASFDDGAHWQPFQLNLPVTPITDLQITEKDLVVATQGRSFWILDDLTPLHQLSESVEASDRYLFAPRGGHRLGGAGLAFPQPNVGQNPPRGVVINYYLKEAPEADAELTLELLDGAGNVVRKLSSKTPEARAPNLFAAFFGGGGSQDLAPAAKGMNRWVWDLRYPDARIEKGSILWGSGQGPKAVPGTYRVRLTVGDWSDTKSFEVMKDPRIDTTQEDFQKQFDLAIQVRDAISASHDILRKLRSVRTQANDLAARLKAAGMAEGVDEAAEALADKLTELENKVYQTENQGFQDPLNYQPMLDNQLVGLYDAINDSEARPTDGSFERYDDLMKVLNEYQSELENVLANELATFNELVQGKNTTPVIVPSVSGGG